MSSLGVKLKILNFNAGTRGGELYNCNSLEDESVLQVIQKLLHKFNPDIAFFQELKIKKEDTHNFQDYIIIFGGQNLSIFFRSNKFHSFQVGHPLKNDFDIGQFHCRNRCLYTRCKLCDDSEAVITAVCVHVPKQNIDSLNKFYRTETLLHLLHVFENRTSLSFCNPSTLENNETFISNSDVSYLEGDKTCHEDKSNLLIAKTGDDWKMNKGTTKALLICGDFNTQFYVMNSIGIQDKLNKKENPLCSVKKFLVSDPHKATTIKGRAIDAMLMKIDNEPVDFVKDYLLKNPVDFQSNPFDNKPPAFDHFVQVATVIVKHLKNGSLWKSQKDKLIERQQLEKKRQQKYMFDQQETAIKKISKYDNNDNRLEELKNFTVKGELVLDDVHGKSPPNMINISHVRALEISGKFRLVHFGQKNGVFYYTPSYNKVYITNNPTKLKSIVMVPIDVVEEWSFRQNK